MTMLFKIKEKFILQLVGKLAQEKNVNARGLPTASILLSW